MNSRYVCRNIGPSCKNTELFCGSDTDVELARIFRMNSRYVCSRIGAIQGSFAEIWGSFVEM